MSVYTLTIDDKPVSIEEGGTILEAAREAGIVIPTLCHLDGVYDIGACRICLVEVAGIPKLLPACSTKVTEGMEVRTDTARLRNYRRMILELLFADWLNALVFEMATRQMLFGRFEVRIEGTRLQATAWGEPVDRDRHRPAVEVKGATYTALRVAREPDGAWVAQAVVDV